MNIKLAQVLCDCHDDFELRENYSGRGMYSKKTTGVICPNLSTLLSAILTNAHFFVDEDGYPLFEHEKFAVDNMGFDVIVY